MSRSIIEAEGLTKRFGVFTAVGRKFDRRRSKPSARRHGRHGTEPEGAAPTA